MKIFFTNKAFQEELYRRMEAKEEAEYVRRRFAELDERIERLYRIVEDLRLSMTARAERKDE